MENHYKDYMSDVKDVMRPFEDLYAPHIAIVDDCMHDRASLRNFIRAYFNDIPVRTYRDGVHFWDTISEGAFPVELNTKSIRAIFLDLHMPEMCGRETLHKIRSSVEFKDTPVFMMSKNGTEEKVSQIMGMGADDFIAKPFDKLALSLLIHKGSFKGLQDRVA